MICVLAKWVRVSSRALNHTNVGCNDDNLRSINTHTLVDSRRNVINMLLNLGVKAACDSEVLVRARVRASCSPGTARKARLGRNPWTCCHDSAAKLCHHSGPHIRRRVHTCMPKCCAAQQLECTQKRLHKLSTHRQKDHVKHTRRFVVRRKLRADETGIYKAMGRLLRVYYL